VLDMTKQSAEDVPVAVGTETALRIADDKG
jgi:hypothetical protein